jgi:hypothetical protein
MVHLDIVRSNNLQNISFRKGWIDKAATPESDAVSQIHQRNNETYLQQTDSRSEESGFSILGHQQTHDNKFYRNVSCAAISANTLSFAMD